MTQRFASDLLILLLAFQCVVAVKRAINNRPIIGILDQPSPDDLSRYGDTYLPASYVKWVESAGARAVPIPHKAPEATLRQLFNSVNGILFTGGGLSLFPNITYYQTAQLFFNLAIEAFNNGDYFPLWGTCQGFQLLSILAAQDPNILQRYAFDSENLPLPLDFTSYAPKSRMFANAPNDIYKTFATQPVTMNLHHDGVDPSLYTENSLLAGMYNLLSMNTDRKGKPFGSTFEGNQLPIYGVQYHPERNQFEWDLPEHLLHTKDAMRAVQYLADFYVEEVRKNTHQFATPQEEANSLIYNWAPVYTGIIETQDSYPEQQTYVFTNLTAHFVK